MKLLSLTLFHLLQLSWLHSVTGQRVASYNLAVPYGNQWGDWGEQDMCPEGFYAAGFSLKVEQPQGSGDDTALNGIRLYCVNPQNKQQQVIRESAVGRWGEWTAVKMCETGYLASYMLRVEPPQGGGDDTSVNNIKFICSGNGAQLEGAGLEWGDWGNWSNKCPKGAICGLKTRVEEHQGNGDDTSLNDVKFFCCK
uniref:Vitelline membrane outer layer 1 homolog a n=1 Tax=Oryzias latipes TaxID=8090 RepID=A0A3P9IX85_ORYLA